MNTTKLSVKKILIPTGLALLLIIGVICYIRPNLNAPKLPPTELAQTAIDNLLAAESLCFNTQSCLLLGDEEMKLGDIHGEINGSDYHINGEVLGTPMDLYQIGTKTYRQDTLTDQWLVLEDQAMLNQEALLSDINPRAAFQLTGILNVSEAETENVAEEKCYKLTFEPQTASGYYEKYFASLTYTIWVTLDDHQLRQAQINASASANNIQSTLQITTDFWDWNNTPPIEAPVIEETATY